MSPTPGTRLGFCEILSAVGAGGMGEVYRAHDHRLNRDVAVKVLPEGFASDPDRLARFEREAQAVAALSHPNTLAIHEFGSAGPTVYAVMELLQGETLPERLAGGPLGVRKALDYASQMARGLAAAHDKGIVHRDLKPENAAVHQHKRAERRGEDGRRLLFTSGHSGLRLLDSLTGTTHDLMSAARGLTEFPSVAKARKHALIAFVEKARRGGSVDHAAVTRCWSDTTVPEPLSRRCLTVRCVPVQALYSVGLRVVIPFATASSTSHSMAVET